SADDPRPGNQANLLRLMQAQGCEFHRATAPFTVTMKKKRSDRGPARSAPAAAAPASISTAAASATPPATEPRASLSPTPPASPASTTARTETETRTFPAGSYLVRMDQP